MPNVTALFQTILTNWGPLTTTWTAPAHCATESPLINIYSSADLPAWGWYAQCSVAVYDCVPTATHTAAPTVTLSSTAGHAKIAYYSPGLYCPSGYATVGIASRDGDKPVNATGTLMSPSTTSTEPPSYNNPVNLMVQALDPSTISHFSTGFIFVLENLDFCDQKLTPHSSMTAHTEFQCYSTLTDYKPTTGCRRQARAADYTRVPATYLYDGSTVSGYMFSRISDSPITTVTTTYDASETSDLRAITQDSLIVLIHKPSDLKSSDLESDGPKSTGASTTSNAAARLNLKSTTWNGLGTVLGVSALGMTIGAAIMVPF
ncbi:hypothetical protein N7457_009790 [Penicillium paradoxum]|uniref:uncharacterized protein n=1 Tax=Penicillium paradoxum TaxID=176176 RepID=UPI0025495D5F|nr:uncharacterized protein N7457_009790 [Penicillium paradoxum]KAJ5774894.1 hypothetical protein N7457_009790 [Penicillium paradoxum]